MKVQVIAAMVSVVANVCLIPVLGIVGAAIAAALLNVGSNVWNLFEVRRTLRLSPYNRGYYKLLIPAGLMMGALALLRVGSSSAGRQWMLLLLALLVSYSVFGVSLLAFGTVEDDRAVSNNLLNRFRSGLQRLGVIA
jgi:O-antigen/teichoic acid export membrane protein